MTTGPCLGCGFSLDGSGNLILNDTTNQEWPYTAPGHTNPDPWLCDTGTDGVKRLWRQPWNLPWGLKAYAQGSGLGVYANGYGPQQVCGVSFTYLKDRVYRISGQMAVQLQASTSASNNASVDWSGYGGASLWNYTYPGDIAGVTFISPRVGYANVVSMSTIYTNATSNVTMTIGLRTYAYGYQNARPLNYANTFVVVEDIGPRL